MKPSTRFNVMEANNMVARNTAHHGFEVGDLHYPLQCQLQQRRDDGIHWTARGNRLMVNLILSRYSATVGEEIEEMEDIEET